MKIVHLDLIAFGPFTDCSLDLSQGNDGLHIIYGLNEAGKSSALRALLQMLYGIPVRSSDNFIHPYGRLRIGATLRRKDGTELQFVRRKGRSGTLREKDDTTLMDETRFRSFLGGVDEQQFINMFGIDHERLVKGGQAIVQGGGELGQILFSAGSGISGIRELQNRLQNDAEELFKFSAQKPRINSLLSELRENRKLFRQAQLSDMEWAKHDDALSVAEKRKAEIDSDLKQKQAERGHLARIQDALPIISERKELLDQLAQIADAPILPENFSTRRQEFIEKLKIEESRQQQAIENLQKIRNRLKEQVLPERILNSADTITAFFQELGSIRKARKDRLRLEGLRSSLRAEAREILKGLRQDISLEQVDTLRLKKKETIHIRELGMAYERLTTRMESVRDEIEKRELHIDRLQKQLDSMKVGEDTDRLGHALDNALIRGDLEKQYTDLCSEIRRREAFLTVEAKKLPCWQGDPATLETLSVPSQASVDDFEYRMKACRDRLSQISEKMDTLEKDRLDIGRRMRELDLKGEIPTEADLLKVRRDRDGLWHDIRHRWFPEKDPNDSNKAAGEIFGIDDELADTFESHLRFADEIGDRLRREADRVARKAGLVSEWENIQTRLDLLKKNSKDADTELATVENAWLALWKSTGIQPQHPREMRNWLRQQTDLAEQFSAIRGLKADADRLKTHIEIHRRELSEGFNATKRPEITKQETLSALMAMAKTVIKQSENHRQKRQQLDTDLKGRIEEQTEAVKRMERLETQYAQWRNDWLNAVRQLGLDKNATPNQANAILDDLKNLFDKVREAEVLDKRIQGIDKDVLTFSKRVNDMAARQAPDLKSLSSEQIVNELNSRLSQALKIRTTVESLEKQEHTENIAIQTCKTKILQIRVYLDDMCRQASCDTYEQLYEAEKRSQKRKQTEDKLKKLEDQIRKLSAGVTLEQFIREADAMDSDQIEPEILNLDEKILLLNERKSELDQTIGYEKSELKRMDGSARAAELAEQAQSIMAGVTFETEQYVRLRMASMILSHSIERYRSKNQGPILSRAGRYFSHMTLGSFESLQVEFTDKNENILVGVRPGGRDVVTVDGMSEGTADQLYLALRLASLKSYLEKNEPLPFIVDDVLIKFDDQRAIATLQVLADLSALTQIIFFTHHRHLVELVKNHIDSNRIIRHDLSC